MGGVVEARDAEGGVVGNDADASPARRRHQCKEFVDLAGGRDAGAVELGARDAMCAERARVDPLATRQAPEAIV